MDEFERGSQVDALLARLPPDRLERKKRHPRPDPFSACPDYMEADVGEQALFTIEAASYASFDLLQLIRYRGVPGHFIVIIIVR
jgi:hypothetical protein